MFEEVPLAMCQYFLAMFEKMSQKIGSLPKNVRVFLGGLAFLTEVAWRGSFTKLAALRAARFVNAP